MKGCCLAFSFPMGKGENRAATMKGCCCLASPLFQMQGMKEAFAWKLKSWHRDRRSTKTPAVFEKRGESGQFRMFGSLGRNARKLRALGPSPRPLE